MATAKRLPFYIELTPVQERWLKEDGSLETLGMPLVTLPAGTVLFRSVLLPRQSSIAYTSRSFYRDYVGDVLDPTTTCMTPTKNVFFYTLPYVGFGLHGVGKDMNAVQVVVLVNPVTVVVAISPSIMVRGAPHVFSGRAPIQRCSTLEYYCKDPSLREIKALEYDNCVHPLYQLRTGVRGWMAIADLDSIFPHGLRKKHKKATEAPMTQYLLGLKGRMPGKENDLLANLYTDGHHHAGFPEIALYPFKRHNGEMLTMYKIATAEDAQRVLYKEALADNLNFLPLATFLPDKTVDMTTGLFSRDRIDPLPYGAAQDQQREIEKQTDAWMTKSITEGITLPHYGKGRLVFDSRTGFYVLEQFVPEKFMIRLPKKAVEADTKRDPERKVKLFESYRRFLMPMSTEEERKRVLTYTLLFRSFVPDKFMHAYGLEKGYGIRRAFVFERPPVLGSVYKSMGLEVPKEFTGPLARAAALYQKETGKVPKPKAPKEEAKVEAKGDGLNALALQQAADQDEAQGFQFGQSFAEMVAENKARGYMFENPLTGAMEYLGPPKQQATTTFAPVSYGPGTPLFPPPPPKAATTVEPVSAWAQPSWYGMQSGTAPSSGWGQQPSTFQFGAPITSAAYNPTSPAYYAPSSPAYFAQQQQEGYVPPPSPPYAPSSPPYAPSSPPYAPGTPEYGASTPNYGAKPAAKTPEGGARGKTRKLGKGKGKGKKQTRSGKSLTFEQSFVSIWKAHGMSKRNSNE